MTEVFVVMQFDATPYESYYDGVHKVFSSREAAKTYIDNVGVGPHWEDKEFGLGYYLNSIIEVWKVYD